MSAALENFVNQLTEAGVSVKFAGGNSETFIALGYTEQQCYDMLLKIVLKCKATWFNLEEPFHTFTASEKKWAARCDFENRKERRKKNVNT